MTMYYSDVSREDQPTALPNVEVFYNDPDESFSTDELREEQPAGWYYWYCFPGCMPDSDPIGPFATEAEALAAARED